ncbi:hypothetical protein AB0N87_26800 [Streptomyces sp. NPDC093228]|uniref:hypothetical protein n=1 Tax=unclassified Streptomyces TaxID=2593676 RepID=UPI00074100F4|nr:MULTISPECIES: hypothetical protein [unclassified Streptomyces]KUJ55796.1 hypothetical protein ADL25_05065 [Streptomyces sp. NRRL F-5122]MDX3263221.1 hypothetical protein [Streptomyces sp. MI02-2A]
MAKQTHRYAVSGLPAFGHGTKAPLLDDRSPLGHGRACAVADAPHSVFSRSLRPLIADTSSTLVDMREQST